MSVSTETNTILEEAIFQMLKSKPSDQIAFLASFLQNKVTSSKTTIDKLVGRQVLDSRGNPTVQVDVYCNINNVSKMVARGTAPSGASTGSNEALELRDNDPSKFLGKGVSKAVDNVSIDISAVVSGKDPLDLKGLDDAMLQEDGTNLKTNLGGNSITAASFALAEAGAKIADKELFLHLADVWKSITGKTKDKFSLPVPMMNLLNGGKHAGNSLQIQEFMVLPRRDITFKEKLLMCTTVYHHLKKILLSKYGSNATNLGDEGGFAPPIDTADEALACLEDAVKSAGYATGTDIFFALDCAASEFYDSETKLYNISPKEFLSAEQLVDYYVGLIQRHPGIISIEDGLDEKDYPGWIKMTSVLGDRIMVVGDDLYTTNPKFIAQGLEHHWANSLLLKVNQIGSITEAMMAAEMLFKGHSNVIVSHRSGETTSSIIADLAVGIGAQYIKTGATARGERTCKYNRLLQIEEYLIENGLLSDQE